VVVAQSGDDRAAAAVEHVLAGEPVKRGTDLRYTPVAHAKAGAATAV
jgi:hypothetical protein